MKKTYLDFEQLVNHPLFDLAKKELVREGKLLTKKEGNKIVYDIPNANLLFVDILKQMLSIVTIAHKNGQKDKLNNYIKENTDVRKI